MLLSEFAEQARLRGAVQPPGYQDCAVHWEVVVAADGSHAQLRQLGEKDGQKLLVPYGVRPGRTSKPFIVVDKAGMVFGVSKKIFTADGAGEAAKAAANHTAYISMLEDCERLSADPGVVAVATWFRNGRPGVDDGAVAVLPEHRRVCFRVDGRQTLVHESAAVQAYWAAHVSDTKSATAGLCIVCGLEGPLAQTFPQQVKAGSLGTEQASLISVNEPAFGRQSNRQLISSPICLSCAQAAVAGLQSLLDTQWTRDGSQQAVKLADDRRLVFWLSGGASGDYSLDALSGEDPADVTRVLNAPRSGTGAISLVALDTFTAVVLAQNKSRVVVSSWNSSSLDALRSHVGAWFRDQVLAPAFPRDYSPLAAAGYHQIWQLEKALANPAAATPQPGVGQALWAGALFGRPLPPRLFAAAVARERTESRLLFAPDPGERRSARRRSAARCALLHLMLVRNPVKGEPMSIAGSLGRMFAVLEALQAAALGELNAPLSARWLARASTNPRAAYPAMLRGANAHLGKLRKQSPGAAYRLGQELDALVSAVGPAGFPAVLSLTDQGHWFIGLHEQRASHTAGSAAGALAKAAAAAATGVSATSTAPATHPTSSSSPAAA